MIELLALILNCRQVGVCIILNDSFAVRMLLLLQQICFLLDSFFFFPNIIVQSKYSLLLDYTLTVPRKGACMLQHLVLMLVQHYLSLFPYPSIPTVPKE